MKLHGTNADGPSAQCDRPLASFDLTDRQARFLVTVMRHGGVFVGRPVCGVRRHHARTESSRLHPGAPRAAVPDLDRTRHDRTDEDHPCALQTFADELALLQPTPGYMRLLKDRILYVWEQRRSEAKDRTVEQERRVKLIQQKLDRLDDAFLFQQSIDATSYERERDGLREELTVAKIDHRADAVDELDVQGILAFAERILPRASDLWVQASLDYKQRLQQLFFPEGIAFDGNRFNRTAATAPLFNYLAPSESADEKMVSREGIEPSTRRLRVCCSAN
jgi:hypothetical protein